MKTWLPNTIVFVLALLLTLMLLLTIAFASIRLWRELNPREQQVDVYYCANRNDATDCERAVTR